MKGKPQDNFTVKDIFQNSQFLIPEYQRDYSWKQKHVRDFVEDVEFVLKSIIQNEDSMTSHYFGTVVLESAGYVSPDNRVELERYRIIDGQQRLTAISILMRTIANELQYLLNLGIESSEVERMVQNTKRDVTNQYVQKGSVVKIQHRGLTKSSFEKVVLNGQNPSTDLSVTERIQTTYEIFEQWLEINRGKITQFDGEMSPSEIQTYVEFLQTVLRVIEGRFEVSINTVEDEDEAARMFKVINGRGRDLTLIDEVQSHIVYCASRDNKLDAEDLSKVFNAVFKNVTMYSGLDEDALSTLVTAHWEAFTGEGSDIRVKRDGPNGIHARLESLERFADVQRENLGLFVRRYSESLRKFSEVFPVLASPAVYEAEANVEDTREREILNRLYSLSQYSTGHKTFLAVLLPVAVKYGTGSQELLSVLREIESHVFRYNIVMKRGTSYNSSMYKLGRDIYWSQYEEREFNETFSGQITWDGVPQNASIAVQEFKDDVRNRRERKAKDEPFVEYLMSEDILNGDFTDGWGGIRYKDSLKFLLYEYERHLQEQSESSDMSSFGYWVENYQLEHLVPQNGLDESGYDYGNKDKNKLGNLALLSPSENNRASNKQYRLKQSDIYESSPVHMLAELPEGELSGDQIDARTRRLAEFAADRW